MTSNETAQLHDHLRPSNPEVNVEQLERFTPESLHAQHVGSFDPSAMVEQLEQLDGQLVIGTDIGGDKVARTLFQVTDGKLEILEEHVSEPTENGAGYLNALEATADTAHKGEHGPVPVGVSFAGPIDGHEPVAGPNVSELMNELSIYENSFGKNKEGENVGVFGRQLMALDNDAVAGLRAGAVEAVRENPNIKNVIYIIDGSGLGGAVLKEGEIYATEPGHIPVVDSLNPIERTEACGMFEQTEPCVERVAGGKAGIEASWFEQTGEALGGREIAKRANDGDPIAIELYENAAEACAVAIVGMAKVMEIPLDSDTAIVGHGGVFRHKPFADRVAELVDKKLLLTHDFSDNACLEGAALAALDAA